MLTDELWLDAHFVACRPEYESMLRRAGIRNGDRVLDAGCGSGSFLPLLSELVGESGGLEAVDQAPANVAAARKAGFQARTGSVLNLPYPDSSFAAVWCANVGQYLSDEELARALLEFKRVVKPGGLVAVKDVDMLLMRVHPGDPFLLARLAQVCAESVTASVQSRGSVRGRELRRWLEHAGLQSVWQKSELIERWAPLTDQERGFFAEWLAFLAAVASNQALPDADLEAWSRLRDPAHQDHPLNHTDFYLCEGQVLAVGRK
ncbi:MAG: methyltransferase domain-containing protein [Candidatus Dormibacter sp.]|uniref:methyltransferase domain-containing protein n=1 Tax=Candidatus Dormibacter sp. TaxID=2973982 RepID=UPI000DB22689|nr:MAG: SAM-dependent methyltransferase [Candidatus Dormibacteraeota bacterium]